ncbi:MAG: hypothetical protein H7246_12915 [Phycisphaerae bacterium]|nr:hypothetical protein [Saprospiraceae bacterium]
MTTIRFFSKYLFSTTLLCLSSFFAQAQDSSGVHARPKSIFELLTQKEAVKMTLETDLTTIIELKKTNQYFPGTLRSEDGKVYRVEMKPRGKFRRKVSVFPPLKLKFKKKDLVADGLDTLNEIKLVLPCYESELGDELIVREYLAYRMFEHLTPASMRARLIRLTIRDTHVEKARRPMFAILLEDEEELVCRLQGQLSEEYGIPTDSLQTNQAAITVMFQYMIGNTDWEISMLRNVRLVRTPEAGKILAVPYDFDFSGLVSAPYSSPSSDSGLKTVRDRFLMSNGLNPESLKGAFTTLRSTKSVFYSLCKSKYLSNEASADMNSFLRSFFEKVEGKKDMPKLIKMDSD